MLSFMRGGPRLLVAESPDGALADWLGRQGSESPSFEEAFDAGDGESCIVGLVDSVGAPVRLADVRRLFLVHLPVEDLLLRMLSDKAPGRGRVRMAPRLLVIRGAGDLGAVVGRIEDEIGAFPGRFLDLVDEAEDGVILSVTARSLESKVALADLHPVSLHVPRSSLEPRELERLLRLNGLRYLNAGLGDRDWYDLEIRVYDRYEAYGIQLERILRIANALELGLVLGESWSKDSPRFLMSIDVYRIRLASYMVPERVKGFLLGLEYLDDGLRVGDYDLMRGDRKVHWSDAAVEGIRDRKELGMRFRRELLGLLPQADREALSLLEDRLRASRRD